MPSYPPRAVQLALPPRQPSPPGTLPRLGLPAIAARLALAGGLGLAAMPAAQAQTAPSQASATRSQHYAIPSGPLDAALALFVAESGIPLAAPPELVRKRHSPGVQGRYSAQEALDRLLSGTGLAGRLGSAGSYVLVQTPEPADATQLSTITVTGEALGATTEGTGSYTTGNMGSATGFALSARETPQSVSVVTRQQMDDQGLTSLADVLGRTTGITMNQYESDRTLPSSRGFEIGKLRYDGLSAADSGFGFETDWFSDSAIYDRVEIVRGATGLLSGTGEPSAAINLVRKKPTPDFQGHVQASAGSWDTYRGELDISGPLAWEGKLRARMVATQGDRKSYLDYYGKRNTGLYGVIEADLPADVTLTAGIDYRNSRTRGATYGAPVPMYFLDGGATDFPTSTSTAADWTSLTSRQVAIFSSLQKQFANGWQARLHYERRINKATPKLRTIEGAPDRETGAGNFWVSGAYYDIHKSGESVEVSGSGPFTLLGREHELLMGYSFYQYKEDRLFYPRLSAPPLDSFYNRDQFPYPQFGSAYRTDNPIYIHHKESGAYLASRLNLADSLKLIIGARLSNISYSLTDWGVTSTADYRREITPYAGLVWDFLENYSAYVSYTDIFKSQTMRDRNGDLLEPLIGNNYEAGIKGAFYQGRLNVSAALFKVDQDNLAEFDAIIDGEYRYKAVKGASVRGFELEISGEPTPGWHLSAGFTRRLARGADGSPLQTEQPQNLLRITTAHQLPGSWHKWTLGGHLTWQSRIYTKDQRPGGGDAEQKSYALAHLFATYQATPNLKLQLNVNNVFNKTYYSGIYLNYGRYGDPRSITANLAYQF